LLRQGEVSAAAEALARALQIAREQGLTYEEAQSLRVLADLARMEGREGDAADVLHQADLLMQRVGATIAAEAADES
jgi:hypothetical protein